MFQSLIDMIVSRALVSEPALVISDALFCDLPPLAVSVQFVSYTGNHYFLLIPLPWLANTKWDKV